MSIHRFVPSVAAALAAIVTIGASADAQLLSRVRRAAGEKVAEAVTGRPADRSGAGNSGSAAGAAAFAITPDRLDAFLVAMRPAVARAERERVIRAEYAAFEKAQKEAVAKRERWEACGERVGKANRAALAAPSREAQMKQAQVAERMAPVMEAFQAAQIAGDQARIRVLSDSLAVFQYEMYLAVMPALAECGRPEPAPVEPAVAREETRPEELIVPPGGMSATEFGRLRERIAVYALTNGSQDPFTDEERAALDARAGDLAPLAALFRDGLLEWESWGGLGEVWKAKAGQR